MALKSIDEQISDMAEIYVEQERNRFYEIWENLGYDTSVWSPIEQLMAYGLWLTILHIDHLEGEGGYNNFEYRPNIKSFEETDFTWRHPYGVVIYPQMKIGKYTADFVVNVRFDLGGEVIGVIECDGHDYHERSKAQAQHDKARDRYFQSLGLIVLRYTGSEIYREPFGTAASAIELLLRRARQQSRGRK